MLNPLFAASSLVLLLAAPAAVPAEAPDWDAAVAALQAQQQQQQQRVTIHVPRVTVTSSTTIIVRSAPRPVNVVEKKTNDCVKLDQIEGFAGVNADSVDLVVRGGSVLRAKLGRDCPALGFYGGFYVKANEDRKVCAERDSFRTRSGRSCDIKAFRRLVIER